MGIWIYGGTILAELWDNWGTPMTGIGKDMDKDKDYKDPDPTKDPDPFPDPMGDATDQSADMADAFGYALKTIEAEKKGWGPVFPPLKKSGSVLSNLGGLQPTIWVPGAKQQQTYSQLIEESKQSKQQQMVEQAKLAAIQWATVFTEKLAAAPVMTAYTMLAEHFGNPEQFAKAWEIYCLQYLQGTVSPKELKQLLALPHSKVGQVVTGTPKIVAFGTPTSPGSLPWPTLHAPKYQEATIAKLQAKIAGAQQAMEKELMASAASAPLMADAVGYEALTPGEPPFSLPQMKAVYDKCTTSGLSKVVHASNKDTWGTPWDFFLWLDQQFDFTLDVCATAENAKCTDFLTPEMDGLEIDWWGRVFMNPPYSHIDRWMEEMCGATKTGEIELGVALVAARPDTQWWWNALVCASEVWFLKGRLTFEGAPNAAPFPSAVMIFRPDQQFDQERKILWVDWKHALTV